MVRLKRQWDEKRLRRRINLDFPVKVGVYTRRFNFWPIRPCCSGTLQDASTEGLLFRVDREIDPGTRLKVWIDAWRRTGRVDVVVRGMAVWSSPVDAGVCLVGVALDERPPRGMQLWWDIVTEHLGLRAGVGATR